ncbi:MAG: peptide ABC transporter substrate-binding protein [Spirochaetia bacterium]|jgi:oligopeptide transport system substrate-binding protein|nr:peptide ABC transporter substrate-binding protein [Spirochaetia bacterium]
MKRVLSGLMIIALALTLAVSCGGKAGAAKGVEFIMNNGAEPQTLDPSKIQGVPEHKIYMALFEGLVGSDPKTSLAVPGVAESWTISEDGKQITYKLRKTTWSDGTKITAQTVVDSWIRTLDPATASEYAYMVGMVIKGADEFNGGKAGKEAVQIRALDDYTFQCDLLGPMPYAVDMMSHYSFAILPMHVINAKGDDWIKVENFVGNGPFTLESWKPQESLSVVPNAKYWDPKNVHLSRVTFLPIDDNLTAYNKFKAGEIDWAHGIPLDLIDEIKLRPDYQVAPQVATYYYVFNMTRAPFTDLRVRRALTMGLNMQELVDKVTKGGQLATTSMVPTMAGYTPAKGPMFNVEEARKLLAEAGYPDGKGFPKTPIIYNTSDGHKKIAEWVQENWKKNLGIEVTLVNQEWKTFLDTRSNAHDFDIARAGWVGDYLDPNTFLDMFIIGSGNNDGLYANPEYDALVKKAATMKAGPERMAVLQQAESFLITKDQAVIPFYHYVEQDMIDINKWDGWFANPLGTHPWKGIKLK